MLCRLARALHGGETAGSVSLRIYESNSLSPLSIQVSRAGVCILCVNLFRTLKKRVGGYRPYLKSDGVEYSFGHLPHRLSEKSGSEFSQSRFRIQALDCNSTLTLVL